MVSPLTLATSSFGLRTKDENTARPRTSTDRVMMPMTAVYRLRSCCRSRAARDNWPRVMGGAVGWSFFFLAIGLSAEYRVPSTEYRVPSSLRPLGTRYSILGTHYLFP